MLYVCNLLESIMYDNSDRKPGQPWPPTAVFCGHQLTLYLCPLEHQLDQSRVFGSVHGYVTVAGCRTTPQPLIYFSHQSPEQSGESGDSEGSYDSPTNRHLVTRSCNRSSRMSDSRAHAPRVLLVKVWLKSFTSQHGQQGCNPLGSHGIDFRC